MSFSEKEHIDRAIIRAEALMTAKITLMKAEILILNYLNAHGPDEEVENIARQICDLGKQMKGMKA